MSTKITEYTVNDAWLDENSAHNENGISTSLNVENENSNNNNNNNNGSNERTYETPLMRQFFVQCGFCPEGIQFTKSEIIRSKICKAFVVIESKILSGPSVFFHCLGYGLDIPTSLLIGGAFGLQHLTFENKTNLILSRSLDMKESLRSPKDCQEMHKEIQGSNSCGLLVSGLLNIVGAMIVGIYPAYMLYEAKQYFGVSVLLVGALLFPFHWPRMYYADFSNRIYSKNEKEIKGYIQSIHNIVLDNEKGRTVDENLKLLEINQKQFKYRMMERKKLFFYHPMNLIMGIVIPLVFLSSLVLRKRTNLWILELAVHASLIIFAINMLNILLIAHGTQLAQGPRVFEKAAKDILSLRFIRNVEKNLNMKYDVFKYWLMHEQKDIVTVKILGNPINGDTTKQIVAIIASLSSLALLYVGRSIVFGN